MSDFVEVVKKWRYICGNHWKSGPGGWNCTTCPLIKKIGSTPFTSKACYEKILANPEKFERAVCEVYDKCVEKGEW